MLSFRFNFAKRPFFVQKLFNPKKDCLQHKQEKSLVWRKKAWECRAGVRDIFNIKLFSSSSPFFKIVRSFVATKINSQGLASPKYGQVSLLCPGGFSAFWVPFFCAVFMLTKKWDLMLVLVRAFQKIMMQQKLNN